MTNEEYQAAQAQVMLLCAFARKVDTSAMLAAIDRAETVAPFTDPTLYRAGAPKLQIVKRCAQAVAALRAKLPSEEECIKADEATERWLELQKSEARP